MSIARFARISEAQYLQDAAAYSVKLAIDEVPLPCRATAGSAGYDFVFPVEVTMAPGATAVIPTGIRAIMDQGWMLMLCPRSSLGRKYGLRLSNTVGIVDSDYSHAENEGHILLVMEHSSEETVCLHAGDRICQGIFLPVGLAREADVTGDRVGGYGSTGK
jgi:dUTP pyrophosphatase